MTGDGGGVGIGVGGVGCVEGVVGRVVACVGIGDGAVVWVGCGFGGICCTLFASLQPGHAR